LDEEFGLRGTELAAPNMNHNGEPLLSGGRNHFGDLTALSGTSDIHGGSREVQLQSDQLMTPTPVADLVNGGLGQRIYGEKSHQALGI